MAENLILDLTTKFQLAQNPSAQESCSKSIYRIPKNLIDVNSQAYEPKLVSFGPYHHNSRHLLPMEESKFSALEKDEFLKIMITDSCFALEIMLADKRLTAGEQSEYDSHDPIFGAERMLYVVPDLKRDMLLLENQLPLLALTTLAIQSVTKLRNVGVSFCKSKTNSFRDISFNGGILSLPQLKIDDTTESLLLNLMAFERLHVAIGNEVTTYVFFMDDLINTTDDIALLRNEEIIKCFVGSDENISKIFNKITKEAILTGFTDGIVGVNSKLNTYCNKRMRRWRANFIEIYLKNHWVFISLFGCLIFLSLTIIKIVYTMLQYYNS
ncbi:UPF0481 protein [Dendrobium catenatum]|uniref:UPF0481 protein n=1 Tax=Dendrobium catenatum TaxID=906689 RepID=A0A2I0WFY2_9ASPA|nr:UPF0481 protein [Dendrobium catenatum]